MAQQIKEGKIKAQPNVVSLGNFQSVSKFKGGRPEFLTDFPE
jgi:hypothetical protein